MSPSENFVVHHTGVSSSPMKRQEDYRRTQLVRRINTICRHQVAQTRFVACSIQLIVAILLRVSSVPDTPIRESRSLTDFTGDGPMSDEVMRSHSTKHKAQAPSKAHRQAISRPVVWYHVPYDTVRYGTLCACLYGDYKRIN